jgi:phosphoribosylaminoimidazolecarboxamide formyltransferase / IMP cyclohydrolase
MLSKIRDLRYGENPHQPAAWYALDPHGLGAPVVLQGKELSFTNLLDLDAAARIVLEFTSRPPAVIKHTNPCGVATGATSPRPTSGRAKPTRWRPSAASSA